MRVFLGISTEELLICLCSEFIFGVRGLALVSSLFCRLQSAVRDVIFSAGVFLGVLGVIALSKMVDCLFRSHFLDVVMDVVAESVSVFSFKKDTNI